MELQTIFNLLGLSEDHLHLYQANLELGAESITNLAKKARIPRTTVYLIIEDLLKIGLVTRTMTRGRSTQYVANDPEVITSLLERRKLELEQGILDYNQKKMSLIAMQNTAPGKPKIEYLEGKEGIMQAYNRSLDAEEIWIQCFTEDYKDVVSDEFFDNYFQKFFSSNIRSKELLGLTDEPYCKKWGSEKNLQLMVDTKGMSVETDIMIYGNTVIFVSFNSKNPYALIVEDKDIANSLKVSYMQAWEAAKVSDPRVKRGEKVRTEFAK
jgi:sugar-specific transcriptional regulator TrmB